ncbi:MAG TPA: hypothetical protein VHE35_29990 [Kofleriaceae bacterium]|nr:hypothetical protein [Kofleriaceae bacterium]
MPRCAIVLVLLAACGGTVRSGGRTTVLRPACAAGERWDGGACVARGGTDDLDAAEQAFAGLQVDAGHAALDRAATHPLDHASYLRLWLQRGQAHGNAEAYDQARADFSHLLDAEPGYAIDCQLGPHVFGPFQEAKAAAATRALPELELRWRRDLRLGDPVPIEIETIADPGALMHDLTVYVRERGASAWRAADVGVPAPGKVERVVLPAVRGKAATALELFAVASDDRGNEVHLWASPDRPRELPLRYSPPTPWYRKWWVWAAAGGVVAVGTGVGVYAAVWQPDSTIDAPVGER